MVTTMRLKLLDKRFSVCRLDDNGQLPLWAIKGDVFAITKIEGELSVICEEEYAPKDILSEDGYRIIKIDEKLEFSMIGVLAELCEVMKNAEISILAVSTYDTDYILIKEVNVNRATEFLQRAGYEFI